ncbi:MAG TPA: lipase family protein [Blastocatellia bacterium]
MSQVGLPNDPNGGLAMSLANAAYATDISACLSSHVPGWTVAWKADQSINGNLAYIGHDGHSQYVVAIRGSEFDISYDTFDDWFEQDLDILEQVPWVYPSLPTKPVISGGAVKGLNNLIQLKQTSGGTSTTMLEFLMANAVPTGKAIVVVGHSLGGNLATVYAPWLRYQIAKAGVPLLPPFSVLTFAAPTAGNPAFAHFFDSTFPNSWRYYNTIDIIPMASDNIVGMGNLYKKPGPQASDITQSFWIPILNCQVTVSLQEVFVLVAFGLALAVSLGQLQPYAQTNQTHGSVALNIGGTLCAPEGTDPLIQWFEQAKCQHGVETYLTNLGVTPFICP